MCFYGSCCCLSLSEGRGFLAHAQRRPNLARHGHPQCALTCRHPMRMCGGAAAITVALGHAQDNEECGFFLGNVSGKHCSLLSSAWLGDSARYDVHLPNLKHSCGCQVGSLQSRHCPTWAAWSLRGPPVLAVVVVIPRQLTP